MKEYLSLTDTTYDALIDSLLTAMSRYVEKYCDVESWLTASYTEYHDGNGAGYIALRNRPVTAVTRIATCPRTVLEIANTSTSVQRAYVSVSSTGITLVSTASGSDTTTSLLFATYPTLAQLATAIEAVSGWDAVVSTEDANRLCSDLRYIQHAGAKESAAELEMYVEELPVSRIIEDTSTIWGCFPCGIQNIEVKYTAGYANVDALPEDLEQGVVALVGGMFRMTQTSSGGGGGVKREKIGDYEIEHFDTTALTTTNLNTVSMDAYVLLQAYRRIHAL